jgi:hypothetical protein
MVRDRGDMFPTLVPDFADGYRRGGDTKIARIGKTEQGMGMD